MSIEVIAILMFLSMMFLLMTGRNIFFIIGAVGVLAALILWGSGGFKLAFFSAYALKGWYAVLAIPPFIFMGLILSKSGVADRLFHTIYLWMGQIRGGLAMGTVVLCAMIAAMSGCPVAATVTAGTIALPAMLKRKYNKTMISGVVQAGGGLGVLIPPSTVFILYGVIARVSIGHLWVAGILPGMLLAMLYIIYIGIRCRLQPHLGPAVSEIPSWRDKFSSLKGGVLPVTLILLVLGLLFLGVTTLVECAAIGAAGSIFCAAFNRKLNWNLTSEVLDETLSLTTMIMWILVAALLFSATFDGLGAIHGMERLLIMAGGGRWGTLLIMQLSFFFMGMVLDDTAMLIIVAPLYIPIVGNLGFDLVWFGVLYVLNCQMAYLTPPFGYCLFILKGIAPKEITIGDIYRSVIPFVGIQAIALVIVVILPQIALWLPSLVFQVGG